MIRFIPNRAFRLALLTLIAAWTTASVAGAVEKACDHCGCACQCRKVCRLVCEMKEVAKTTYSCKCEDICVLGPSIRATCDCSCGHCPQCRATSWIPQAKYVKTRRVPEKKTVTVQKPTYRFVVEYLCRECCAECGK